MPQGPKGVLVLVAAASGRQCERWVYERDFKDALSPASTSRQSSGLTYRRLPSANDKCLFNTFLNVGNKFLVA